MFTTQLRRSALALSLLLLSGAVTACASAPTPPEVAEPSEVSAQPSEVGELDLDAELSAWRRDWSAHFCDPGVLALGDERCLELEADAVQLADRALTEVTMSDASQVEGLMDALAKTNDAISAYRDAGCENERVTACDGLGARLGTAIGDLAKTIEAGSATQ